jgi:small subunit ribosomal protein S6
MPLYETVLIARQDMTPAQVDELAASIETIITDGEGKILKTDNWGLRSLAYRINKNKKGYYVLFNIECPAPAMIEAERLMRLNEDILRYQTLRVEEFHNEAESRKEKYEKEAA